MYMLKHRSVRFHGVGMFMFFYNQFSYCVTNEGCKFSFQNLLCQRIICSCKWFLLSEATVVERTTPISKLNVIFTTKII